MTYKNTLTPWCIIRPFPNMRSRIVGRFRRRVDAEGHLRILKQMIPHVRFEIMFDITPDPSEEAEKADLIPPTSLPCKGMGESGSPLRTSCRSANTGEGQGERSTEG